MSKKRQEKEFKKKLNAVAGNMDDIGAAPASKPSRFSAFKRGKIGRKGRGVGKCRDAGGQRIRKCEIRIPFRESEFELEKEKYEF